VGAYEEEAQAAQHMAEESHPPLGDEQNICQWSPTGVLVAPEYGLLVRCSAGLVTTDRTFTRGNISCERGVWATVRYARRGVTGNGQALDVCSRRMCPTRSSTMVRARQQSPHGLGLQGRGYWSNTAGTAIMTFA